MCGICRALWSPSIAESQLQNQKGEPLRRYIPEWYVFVYIVLHRVCVCVWQAVMMFSSADPNFN